MHVLVDPHRCVYLDKGGAGKLGNHRQPNSLPPGLPSSDRSQDGLPSVVVQDNKVHILAALMDANRRTSSPISSDQRGICDVKGGPWRPVEPRQEYGSLNERFEIQAFAPRQHA